MGDEMTNIYWETILHDRFGYFCVYLYSLWGHICHFCECVFPNTIIVLSAAGIQCDDHVDFMYVRVRWLSNYLLIMLRVTKESLFTVNHISNANLCCEHTNVTEGNIDCSFRHSRYGRPSLTWYRDVIWRMSIVTWYSPIVLVGINLRLLDIHWFISSMNII